MVVSVKYSFHFEFFFIGNRQNITKGSDGCLGTLFRDDICISKKSCISQKKTLKRRLLASPTSTTCPCDVAILQTSSFRRSEVQFLKSMISKNSELIVCSYEFSVNRNQPATIFAQGNILNNDVYSISVKSQNHQNDIQLFLQTCIFLHGTFFFTRSMCSLLHLMNRCNWVQ